MPFVTLGGKSIPFVLVRKKNKNAYVRIAADGSIVVTAPRSFTETAAERVILRHERAIVAIRERKMARIVPPEGMIDLWGAVVPQPAGWIDHDYVKATVVAAQTAFFRLKETLPATLVPDGLSFRARRMKTRFGVINLTARRVTLNAFLAHVDPKYLEAILLHELVHLAHPDHGKGFYDTLLSLCPDYRRTRRQLGILFSSMEG
jgi:predicted metal-dependent hydrolase